MKTIDEHLQELRATLEHHETAARRIRAAIQALEGKVLPVLESQATMSAVLPSPWPVVMPPQVSVYPSSPFGEGPPGIDGITITCSPWIVVGAAGLPPMPPGPYLQG